MLTTKEKVFIRDWEIQKEGPKWKYYLQYIIAWSTVIFLSLFFLLKLIMADRSMGGWTSFYIVAPVSVAMAVLITHLVYQANEKKLQQIKQREVNLD
ncbi:MAG TPA: hypothetical protein VIM07_16615 [Chitinophagaceae bacterium]